MLTPEAVAELAAIHEAATGQRLSEAEVRQMGERLVRLVEALLRHTHALPR